MDKILIIGTGGTIACVKGDNIHLDKAFKILDYVNYENVEFECVSPFTVLSENMDFNCWQKLVDCLKAVDFTAYKGVIILHGSDTLSFTASLVANAFYGKSIALVASDKPLEDPTANGINNFKKAVDVILAGSAGTFVSYDGIFAVDNEPELKAPCFNPKNILVIKPYVNICYDNFSLAGVDTVLHEMYHSATAPQNVLDFIEKCKKQGVKFYFVTENSKAEYESAKDFENIFFNSSLEKVYARILLTK